MKITILDSATLGADMKFDIFEKLGETVVWHTTEKDQVAERIKDSDVVVTNKMKLNGENLKSAGNLKLICVTATGFDNIDTAYCKENKIAVCNVSGYSTNSVTQVTVSLALSLACHLTEYGKYSKSGEYTRSGVANMLTPVYNELSGKTWGIIGMGNIGRQVAKVARALGCRVIYTRHSADENACTLDELLQESHIISIHTPLTSETKGMIGKRELDMCSRKPILINVARGAVTDEAALTEAVIDGRLSGLGIDVYSVEPFGEDHPYQKLRDYDNVILTPHMAWGAYESRVRLLDEILENIKSFYGGGNRGRIV